jgi:hypothetical protein
MVARYFKFLKPYEVPVFLLINTTNLTVCHPIRLATSEHLPLLLVAQAPQAFWK